MIPATRYPTANVSGDGGPEADAGGDHEVAEKGQKEAEGSCEAKKDTVDKGNNKS